MLLTSFLCVLLLSWHMPVHNALKVFTEELSVIEEVEAALEMKNSDRPIVYLFSLSYGRAIVQHLVNKNDELMVSESDFFCFHINATGDGVLRDIEAVAGERSKGNHAFTFLVVSGTESLVGENEVGKLNFLHSITDANSNFANLVILLLWDIVKSPFPDQSHVEEYLLSYFSKGGQKMNPRALYGRISTIFIEPDDTTAAFNEADFLCQDYRSSFHGQSHLVRVATLLSVAILVSLFCILRIWYPDNRMENGQLQNEVKKKIIDKGNSPGEAVVERTTENEKRIESPRRSERLKNRQKRTTTTTPDD